MSKTTTLYVQHAFFVQNFLISRARFMVEVNAAQKLSFSKIRYGPLGFKSQKISPTFDKKNETE